MKLVPAPSLSKHCCAAVDLSVSPLYGANTSHMPGVCPGGVGGGEMGGYGIDW